MVYNLLSIPFTIWARTKLFPMAELLFGLLAQVVTIPLPTIAHHDLQVIITNVGIVV